MVLSKDVDIIEALSKVRAVGHLVAPNKISLYIDIDLVVNLGQFKKAILAL